MKVNMPVTDREVELQPGQILVSKTDLKGAITYANKDFIEISGFTEDELIHKNHNLVRHPDMPPEAFKDLWSTIQKGKPWTGLVKNRCKNGDYYWVAANVTPVYQNGQIVEYMSVRHRPERDEVQQAETLYRDIREKRKLLGGTPLQRAVGSYHNISFKNQSIALIFVTILMLGFAAYEGYRGMHDTVSPISQEHAASSQMVEQANRVLVNFKIQVQEWKNVLLRGNDPENFDKYLDRFKSKQRLIQSELHELNAKLQSEGISIPEVSTLIDSHGDLGNRYLEAIKSYDQYNVRSYAIVDKLVRGIDRQPTTDMDALVSKLSDLADKRFEEKSTSIEKSLSQTLSTFLVCMAGAFFLFLSFFTLVSRGVLRPISSMMESFRLLGEGNFTGHIEISGDNEVSHIRQALKSMQIKLGFDINNAQTQAEESLRIKNALDVCDTNVMLADLDMQIIYMNNSVQEMFKHAEKDIQTDLPDFNADQLLGANADIFHKNPAHQRGLIEKLNSTYRTTIKVGRRTFTLMATPVLNPAGNKLGVVIEWSDITEELAKSEEESKIANENARIKQALDNVSASVMVADNDRNIIYVNDAVLNTLRNAENDLRKDLPNFSADNLLGTNIDTFHKHPEHQKDLINNLTSTHQASIIIGGRHLDLTVSPVNNDNAERLGSVVEWKDRTEEVAIEREIDSLVEAASQGNLSKRIDMDGKTGFFQKLSLGLNTLVSSSEMFVTDIGALLSAMSEGNLTQKVNSHFEGEFERIRLDANTSIEKLTEIVGQIRESASAVYTASNEIAEGNADLSQRTEEQASSLEETASSMEQMTSTVKHSSDNAKNATDLANEARSKAQQGGEVVKHAVDAMGEILTSSHKINDIIGVIDEIAFQTNLLALNAAVEAARAGEQGRGFAVVAGEVRNLSQRSAAAAKEIKDLIKDSVTKVEAGSMLVNESGSTLNAIVLAVEKVAVIIGEVNSASSEQTQGIEQINQAVSQMDEMTQQNAALVEEASAASEAMSEQASNMNQLVGFFKVGHADQSLESNTAADHSPTQSIKTYQPQPAPPRPSAQRGTQGLTDDDDWEEF